MKHNLKRNKFGAKPTEYNGWRYDSKAEAAYARALDARVRNGTVLCWLAQVPIRLPGRTKYVVDFQVFNEDGTVQFIDVKGHPTDMFKLKKRQVEALYPFEIEVVK